MTRTSLAGRSIRAGWTLVALVWGAGSMATAQTGQSVLYVPNFNTTANGVLEFLVGSGGVLTAKPAKPTAQNASEIVVTPNRKFLFVGENGAIDVFTIATDGTATPAPTTTITGNISGLAVDTSGTYLYAVNSSGHQLETYTINQSTGVITLLGAPLAFPSTYALRGMTIDKNNDVYVAVVNNGSGSGWVAAYKIGAGGALSFLGNFTVGTASGLGPSRIVTNPAGTMLFTSDSFDAAVSQFTISGTGALSFVAINSPGGSTQPLGITISPNGSYLLVTDNSSAGGVYVYTIGSGASLALVAGSPFSAGAADIGVTVDPTGANVFVSSFGADTVTRFAMNSSTGVLSSPIVTTGFSNPEFLLATSLPAVAVTTVPALPTWGLLLLAMLLAGSGVLMYRRAYRRA